MFNTDQIAQVNATFYSAQCYNMATRRVFRDRQIAQLWERMGDIYRAAALHYQARVNEADRDAAVVAEWENMMAWENMPCGDEA